MGILSTSVLLILAFTIWYLSALPSNYRAAKNSGLPIRFGLWGSANPLWLVVALLLLSPHLLKHNQLQAYHLYNCRIFESFESFSSIHLR